MTQGQVDRAIRAAINLVDNWNATTGFIPKDSSYYYEIMSLIEDAVHCGAQAATGDFKRLEGEPLTLFRMRKSHET